MTDNNQHDANAKPSTIRNTRSSMHVWVDQYLDNATKMLGGDAQIKAISISMSAVPSKPEAVSHFGTSAVTSGVHIFHKDLGFPGVAVHSTLTTKHAMECWNQMRAPESASLYDLMREGVESIEEDAVEV